MKKEEKEYLLKIINLQESMIQGLSSKNFSKMVIAQKELERMQKSSFETVIQEEKAKKEVAIKRFRNLVSELESILKGIL